jgi:hypothetical protein
LQDLSPADRVAALERGWWRDGDSYIVTRAGERLYRPTEARRLEALETELYG